MQAKQPRSDILYMTTLDTGGCSHKSMTGSVVIKIADDLARCQKALPFPESEEHWKQRMGFCERDKSRSRIDGGTLSLKAATAEPSEL